MLISIRREEGQLIIAITNIKGNSSDTSFADMCQQALSFGEASLTYPRIVEVLIRDEDNFIAWFAQILRKNVDTFNRLGVSNYLMDSHKCKLIGDALRQNTVIKELELHNFAAQGADITPIANAIANSPSLEVLSLELERSQTTEWKILGDALINQRSITELSVDTKREEFSVRSDNTFRFVARILEHNTTITSLRLHNPLDLSQEEFNYFCKLLTANTLLKRLTLGVKVNSLGFLDPLCNYLRTTRTLKRLCLSLSSHVECEQDIGKLGQALSVNSSLTALSFDIDKPMPKQFFSSVVKGNSNIKSLTAHGIANDDAIEVVKTTTSLTEILFYSNEFGLGDSEEMMKLALENNYSLRSSYFGGIDELTKTICQRNKDLQKQWYQDTALSIHVMARSHLFSQLPTELWIAIFSKIRYPGLESFEPMAKSILKMFQRN